MSIRQRLHKKSMTGRIRKQNGSTLIEILVSMLIVMITVLGGLALYFNASELQKMAVHKKMATELANTKMEKLRAMNCTTIGLLDHAWNDLQVGGLLISGVDKGIKVLPPVFIDLEEPIGVIDYCEVVVQIKWNEVGQINRDFDINLATFVAP